MISLGQSENRHRRALWRFITKAHLEELKKEEYDDCHVFLRPLFPLALSFNESFEIVYPLEKMDDELPLVKTIKRLHTKTMTCINYPDSEYNRLFQRAMKEQENENYEFHCDLQDSALIELNDFVKETAPRELNRRWKEMFNEFMQDYPCPKEEKEKLRTIWNNEYRVIGKDDHTGFKMIAKKDFREWHKREPKVQKAIDRLVEITKQHYLPKVKQLYLIERQLNREFLKSFE